MSSGLDPATLPNHCCRHGDPRLSRVTGGMEYHVDSSGPGVTSLLRITRLHNMRTGHQEPVGHREACSCRRALRCEGQHHAVS